MITDCGFTNRSHTNRENSKSNLPTKKNWENYKKKCTTRVSENDQNYSKNTPQAEACNKNTGEWERDPELSLLQKMNTTKCGTIVFVEKLSRVLTQMFTLLLPQRRITQKGYAEISLVHEVPDTEGSFTWIIRKISVYLIQNERTREKVTHLLIGTSHQVLTYHPAQSEVNLGGNGIIKRKFPPLTQTFVPKILEDVQTPFHL